MAETVAYCPPQASSPALSPQLLALKNQWRLDGSHDTVEEPRTLLEEILSSDPLGKKVLQLRNSPNGLPVNWYDMPGTGFWMNTQLDHLPREWSSQDLQDWLERTRGDIQGFTLEYLVKKGVFPIEYQINGDMLTATSFGDKKITDLILPQEREGVLLETVRRVEDFFTNPNVSDGSTVLMPSLHGESGLTDPSTGRHIIFPDDQWYVFTKMGDRVKGFTIRTSPFTHSTAKQVIERLGGQVIGETPQDFLRASIFGTLDIVSIVKILKETQGGTFAYTDLKSGKTVSWEEIQADLRRTDLWDFPSHTERFYGTFSRLAESIGKNVTDSSEVRLVLKQALAVTIMDISDYLHGQLEEVQVDSWAGRRDVYLDEYVRPQVVEYVAGYKDALKRVQAVGGCAGGGEEDPLTDTITRLIKSLAPRIGLLDNLDKATDYLNDPGLCRCGGGAPHFHCPKDSGGCGHAIVVGKGIEACPSCGKGKTC